MHLRCNSGKGDQEMTNEEIRKAMRVGMERRGLMPGTIAKRDMHLLALMRWLGDDSILTATKDQINTFLDGRKIGAR